MLIATYNICHGHFCQLDMKPLAEDIRRARADVVGLQEVDVGTARVGGRDTLRELSRASGLAYSEFAPAIPLLGGRYGTAVLSRYPLGAFTVTPYAAQAGEKRVYSRVVITAEGARVALFNTHLDNESADVRRAQMKELAAAVEKETTYILTGDFNENDLTAFDVFTGRKINTPNERYATFPPEDLAIDNIIFSENLRPVSAGMLNSGHSDHALLWAQFTVKKNR